jgi:hypothetical protein
VPRPKPSPEAIVQQKRRKAALCKKWRQANPEKMRGYARRWYRANAEKVSARKRELHPPKAPTPSRDLVLTALQSGPMTAKQLSDAIFRAINTTQNVLRSLRKQKLIHIAGFYLPAQLANQKAANLYALGDKPDAIPPKNTNLSRKSK